jgi:hypothetical protein
MALRQITGLLLGLDFNEQPRTSKHTSGGLDISEPLGFERLSATSIRSGSFPVDDNTDIWKSATLREASGLPASMRVLHNNKESLMAVLTCKCSSVLYHLTLTKC